MSEKTENNNSITIINSAPELKSIGGEKANIIRKTFEPMADMLSEFEEKFSEIMEEKASGITDVLTKKAKRLRLDIRKVRTGTEKIRKEQKEEYLRAGKAIDGVSNILKWAVTDKENKLEEIENHFEIQEQKRLDALQMERVELLSEWVDDASERQLSSLDKDTFDALLSTKKQQRLDMIEAEKKAEEERIAKEKADAEERERIRIENERLKKEAAERERLAKIEAEERAKEEKDRRAKEEKAKREREEAARIEREKHESELRRQREEQEKKLNAERAERERLAKIEAEERRKREKLEQQIKEEKQAELRRRDEEKKMRANAELQEKNRSEIVESLRSNGSINKIVDAIMSGKIPHVKYIG